MEVLGIDLVSTAVMAVVCWVAYRIYSAVTGWNRQHRDEYRKRACRRLVLRNVAEQWTMEALEEWRSK